MFGDSLTTAVLQRALDGTWRREKVVAANIANHETPGYKAIKVDFEEALDRAVRDLKRKTETAGGNYMSALDSVKRADITVRENRVYSERADASNVNLEEENVEMAKVQLQYSYLTRQITDTFSRLRYAIREGR
ncbi:MAG: flagellar basal body rod protein FlgB [Clostridiales Family XIII bacterium]|jgi:flagellar basal-body rod protein FlgB|nr:flagellar basal body rod protein FlgB [Clostridiales Family XIII bacterium]